MKSIYNYLIKDIFKENLMAVQKDIVITAALYGFFSLLVYRKPVIHFCGNVVNFFKNKFPEVSTELEKLDSDSESDGEIIVKDSGFFLVDEVSSDEDEPIVKKRRRD